MCTLFSGKIFESDGDFPSPFPVGLLYGQRSLQMQGKEWVHEEAGPLGLLWAGEAAHSGLQGGRARIRNLSTNIMCIWSLISDLFVILVILPSLTLTSTLKV